MFEITSESTRPCVLLTTQESEQVNQSGPGESTLLDGPALLSGPILGARQSRVSFKSVKLRRQSGDPRTEGWVDRGREVRESAEETSHAEAIPKGHSGREESRCSGSRLPIAALSLTQISEHHTGWRQRSPQSVKGPEAPLSNPSLLEPSLSNSEPLFGQPLEREPDLKRRRERGTNLLQRVAAIPRSWFRNTRVRAAHSKTLMRNIPLLQRAGIGALAGGLAGGITNATLHPIDTVKTKLQAKGGIALYSGPWDVVQKVLAKQGVRGFYRGLPAAVVGSVPSSAVYFGTYELGKELLLRFPAFEENRLAVPPVAAAVGNVASSAILVPKELIKQRLQAGAAGTARGVLASIVREEGFKGLYRGYSAALLRNVPSNVISFSTFEYLKAAWLARSGETELRPWQSLLSGAIAGMLSAATTTPLDVVKTRLMTEARHAVSQTGVTGKAAEAVAKAQFVSAFTPSGVLSTLRQISADEGFKGLVRGAGPRILYGGCFSAMGFLSFETAKHILLERYMRQKERERLESEVGEPLERVAALKDTLGTSEAIAGPRESESDGSLGDRLQGASLPKGSRTSDPTRR